jgi:2'-5' RNA ligase
MAVRSFIAFDTPESVKSQLSEIQAKLRTSGADVRWEPREKFHATIKFLGDVEENSMPPLVETIKRSLGGVKPFKIECALLGCFPNIKRPRVVWVGCDNTDGVLENAKNALDDALLPLGFEKEDREFHSHVTLGRIRSPRRLRDLTQMLETVTFATQTFVCEEILLMRSVLKSSGSEYSLVQSFPLS